MIFGKTGGYSGEVISGIAFYVEPTRPDAAPINATVNTGDRWYNTTDNTEWFWNGTYWLNSNQKTLQGFSAGGTTHINTYNFSHLYNEGVPGKSYLIERFEVQGTIAAPGGDLSNYWQPAVSNRSAVHGAFIEYTPVDSKIFLQGRSRYAFEDAFLMHFQFMESPVSVERMGFTFIASPTGSPPSFTYVRFSLFFREAYQP